MISPPFSGRHSGRATPSLRASQKTAHDKSNRQKLTYPELKSVQTKPTTPRLLFLPQPAGVTALDAAAVGGILG